MSPWVLGKLLHFWCFYFYQLILHSSFSSSHIFPAIEHKDDPSDSSRPCRHVLRLFFRRPLLRVAGGQTPFLALHCVESDGRRERRSLYCRRLGRVGVSALQAPLSAVSQRPPSSRHVPPGGDKLRGSGDEGRLDRWNAAPLSASRPLPKN